MGDIINARCPGCQAAGEDLFVGLGMIEAWPWQGRMYACDPCNKLVMAEMLMPLAELRRVADGTEQPPAGACAEFPRDLRELAQLLVRAHEWPVCDCCRTRLSGQSRRPEADPAQCPRCGHVLEVTHVGDWD